MVSTVGLGCNNFGSSRMPDDQVPAVVNAALDAGITLFDTADCYSRGRSEELLGQALGARRDEVVIATKFGLDMGGDNGPDFGARGSRRYIRVAVEASLRRLGTDRIDLFQLHRPDGITPIEETLSALDDLIREGKVRYIGSSNLSGWEIVNADWVATTRGHEAFISVQNEYSWLRRDIEQEVVPAVQHTGLGLLPYFPLASGLLTGKYRGGTDVAGRLQGAEVAERDREIVDRLARFAEDRGISMLDVAIGGLAAMPTVTSVIAGATTPEQVRQNVAAGQWIPEPEDLAELRELTG